MNLQKKSSRTQTVLIGILLAILVVGFFAAQTTDTPSEPTGSASATVSAEAPAEKEPVNTTPALIGGVAAMAVYYLGSVAIGAVKRKKQNKKDS